MVIVTRSEKMKVTNETHAKPAFPSVILKIQHKSISINMASSNDLSKCCGITSKFLVFCLVVAAFLHCVYISYVSVSWIVDKPNDHTKYEYKFVRNIAGLEVFGSFLLFLSLIRLPCLFCVNIQDELDHVNDDNDCGTCLNCCLSVYTFSVLSLVFDFVLQIVVFGLALDAKMMALYQKETMKIAVSTLTLFGFYIAMFFCSFVIQVIACCNGERVDKFVTKSKSNQVTPADEEMAVAAPVSGA